MLAVAVLACGSGTRNTAVTKAPEAVAPQANRAPVFVSVQLANAELQGGHHEGSAQVAQPLHWGMPDEQRQALVGNLPLVVARTVRHELDGWGFALANSEQADKAHVAVHVAAAELNTYGAGFDGFGTTFQEYNSAGDYWEATLRVSEITLHQNDARLGAAPAHDYYAKAEPCPAKLDITALGLTEEFLAPVSGEVPFADGATYRIDVTVPNPVVMASRHIARTVAELLNQSGPSETSLAVGD